MDTESERFEDYDEPGMERLEDYAEPEEQGMHPFFLVLLLGALAFGGYMMLDGFESETYFYEVDKAVAQKSGIVGKTIRIKGKVEPGSVVGKDGTLGRTFRLAEKGKSLTVTYDKALPDTFKEGMEVVAQGRVDQNYVMKADEVVVKCPSRYEGNAPTGEQAKDKDKVIR